MPDVSLRDLSSILGPNCIGSMAQVVGLTSRPICVRDVAGRVGHNYLTQHYDHARTGWNPYEQMLTISYVKNSLKPLPDMQLEDVNDLVEAQPLYLRDVAIPSQGTHNVVFVVTMNNWVYAFDADKSMPPLWHRLLTPGADPFQSGWGILSTPVIDLPTKTLYVVTHSQTPDGSQVQHRLHALDVGTGLDRPGSGIQIEASFPGTDQHGNQRTWTFDSHLQLNRPGLLLQKGRLYLAFGGFNDTPPWHGWVLAYDTATLQQVGVFNSTPDHYNPHPPQGSFEGGGGGIWQSGMGLAADPGGFIYFTTGNGLFNANQVNGRDYGDSVLKLRYDLTVADYFTPCNQEKMYEKDYDLSSGGVMVVPGCPENFLVACGKTGRIYVLDRRSLGRYTPPIGDPCHDNVIDSHDLFFDLLGQTQAAASADTGVFGGPTYYETNAGRRIYYCSKPSADGHPVPLGAWAIDPNGKLALVDQSGKQFNNGAIPVISSNGSTDGIVWLVDASNNSLWELYAYDASNLSQGPLRVLDAGKWIPNPVTPYPVPTVINGKVYVPSAGKVMVFG